ncbi:MAG: type II secretion system protein [Verrucomicrobia bacterium]|nr:type II secretion system protein [Verrucomicrobiota bacterium]
MSTSHHPSRGFSLLEVVIALALVVIAAGMVFAFFPKAKRAHVEDKEKIAATFIAERIINTLQATLPEGIVATAPDWSKNSNHCLRLSLDQPSEHYFAYDVQGRPRREVNATEYDPSLNEGLITSLAKVSIIPQPPEMTRVTVVISTPATLPDKKRHHSEFTFYLSNVKQASLPHEP